MFGATQCQGLAPKLHTCEAVALLFEPLFWPSPSVFEKVVYGVGEIIQLIKGLPIMWLTLVQILAFHLVLQALTELISKYRTSSKP